MRARFIAALLILAFPIAAQQAEIEQSVSTEQKPWTHLDLNNDSDSFQFAIVTDRTGGHRPGVFMDGVRKLNLLQPEFVMSVGDLIEGYTTDPEVLAREWAEFNGFVEALEMPFFYIPGNHDISNLVMQKEYEERFGKRWYDFTYKDVLFICLDSEDPPDSQMSQKQVDYVRETLAANQDVRWTLVFIHKPLWKRGDPEANGWAQVEEMLQGRPHSVFAGHTHRYYKHERNNMQYIVLATMGGGSGQRGPNFGEFDHFMWVTMTDTGPRFANLMLDGIWDTNVYTERRAALMQPVLAGAAVKTDGIVLDQRDFESASTVLRLTNDADLPMEISLVIRQEEWLTTSVKRIQRTIPPNSVEAVALELSAPNPVPVRDLPPLQVRWDIVYAPEADLAPLKLSGTHRIVVDTQFDATPTSGVTVDGSLRDWTEMAVRPTEPAQLFNSRGAWMDNVDASVDFSVAYDAEHLYIAIDGQDDELMKSSRPSADRQDHLRITLDARPSAQRAQENPDTLDILCVPGVGVPEWFEGESPVEGLRVVSNATPSGYETEIAIPLSYITALQGADWDSVRINIGQHDVDSDGRATLWWRPQWGSPADYASSGTFVRR